LIKLNKLEDHSKHGEINGVREKSNLEFA